MDYDSLLAVIKRRRSIRQYKPERVPIEDVMKVLEAARWASSGRNTQPWEFVVVRDKDRLRQVIDILMENYYRLRDKAPQFSPASMEYLRGVTTFIVVCGDPRFRVAYPQSNASEELSRMFWENSERIYIQSISAAICNILLAAASLGLGAVWWTGTGESITGQQLKAVLKIPEALDTICCIPLGYPSGEPSLRTPRPLGNMVHFDEFDVSKWRPDQFVERFARDALFRAEFYKTGRVA